MTYVTNGLSSVGYELVYRDAEELIQNLRSTGDGTAGEPGTNRWMTFGTSAPALRR